jgi:NTE family protein
MPDVSGLAAGDYSKTDELAARGYAAAESQKTALLKYALPDAQWEAYMAKRHARERPAVGTVLQVKVKASTREVAEAVHRKFDLMVNQPVNTDQIEALLADIRADGRYNADYTVGYDSAGSDRPIILVDVEDKKNGPPFAAVGFNIEAQTGGVTRATVDSRVIYQDLGGYGSEARAKIDLGFLTQLDGEYFHLFTPTGYFVAPRVNMTREPFYIYQANSERRLSERQSQLVGIAADVGWTDTRSKEVRVGWSFNNVQWHTTTGFDNLPDYAGNSQTVRVRYAFTSQDRALVPRFGMRLASSFGYLYGTPGSPSAPQFYTEIEGAHTLDKKNVFLAKAEGATMFNRDVAQPFRYTLGGPLRLSAEAIDQIRGTDYWLVAPGYLRQVFALKPPLGQNIYVGGAVEAGQMRSPDGPTITREDVYFGIVAETPLGVITFAPAFGTSGERKFNFTIGRFF